MTQTSAAPTYLFVFRHPEDMPELTPEQMQQSYQKWADWIQSMRAQGQYLAGEPLEENPARLLRGARGAQNTDGPFAEAKEVIGGFMRITARDFAHAVEIARACPGLGTYTSVEVRQAKPLPGV